MSQILLKADDFSGLRSTKWDAFLAFCRDHDVPAMLGLIGARLEQGIGSHEHALDSSDHDLFEIWNHGYRHNIDSRHGITEFFHASVKDQIISLRSCQQAAEKHLGVELRGFGPPFNKYDVNTLRALQGIESITHVFDIPYLPGRISIPTSQYVQCDGRWAGDKFNLELAVKRSKAFVERNLPFVLQIHPGNKWESDSIDAFGSYYECMVESGYRFVHLDEWTRASHVNNTV